MNKNISTLTAISFAAALTLAACGGGGGDSGGSSNGDSSNNNGSSSTPPASTATSANVTTPQYAADSAQLAIFNTINQQRQRCGFPALTENTQLDSASQAHADYIGNNGGTITDSEVSTNAGYTGVTYADRATKVGYPASTVSIGGESAGYWTGATLSEAAYGTNIANAWASGVYHIGAFVWPVTQIGIGWNETTYSNFPEAHGVITTANLQKMSGSVPLMFPCDGATGVPYKDVGESPTPPNSNGTVGPALAVASNPGDTVVLTSGTLTDTLGNVVSLQVLNASTDPNKLIQTFEARAYSATPLTANTKYSVSLSGTINGTPFSRTGSFTTGS
ncbi:CAP domain-containing protein [Paraburkholderia sp. CNPSo 3155]|nr:CAP domain-containing protein [Paraburkholderia atlantica]MPW08306.1 CAP domain-containing protein [Paraburkholderia atlantica]NUY35638.1 CAP domain-containing protein [Paraburkholderia atlantica]